MLLGIVTGKNWQLSGLTKPQESGFLRKVSVLHVFVVVLCATNGVLVADGVPSSYFFYWRTFRRRGLCFMESNTPRALLYI
jgi:hypothetical protein